MDNDVGIAAADFITKPVRLAELLDWLGQHLALQWCAAPAPVAPPALPSVLPPAASAPPPSRTHLLALHDVVRLGYPRGVQKLLDQIESERPECAPWLAPLRVLAQAFQFDRMTQVIQHALAHSELA